mmetsp:Transcript_47258/g.117999  ORF Transcript_47258/g.117999 Transcript_47258/m.117999 type:complete len:300 (+) Transcript_47258:409-1308(+)
MDRALRSSTRISSRVPLSCCADLNALSLMVPSVSAHGPAHSKPDWPRSCSMGLARLPKWSSGWPVGVIRRLWWSSHSATISRSCSCTTDSWVLLSLSLSTPWMSNTVESGQSLLIAMWESIPKAHTSVGCPTHIARLSPSPSNTPSARSFPPSLAMPSQARLFFPDGAASLAAGGGTGTSGTPRQRAASSGGDSHRVLSGICLSASLRSSSSGTSAALVPMKAGGVGAWPSGGCSDGPGGRILGRMAIVLARSSSLTSSSVSGALRESRASHRTMTLLTKASKCRMPRFTAAMWARQIR